MVFVLAEIVSGKKLDRYEILGFRFYFFFFFGYFLRVLRPYVCALVLRKQYGFTSVLWNIIFRLYAAVQDHT